MCSRLCFRTRRRQSSAIACIRRALRRHEFLPFFGADICTLKLARTEQFCRRRAPQGGREGAHVFVLAPDASHAPTFTCLGWKTWPIVYYDTKMRIKFRSAGARRR